MFGPILAILLAVVLVAVLRASGELRAGKLFGPLIVAGYVVRLVIQSFVRDIQLFSHELGSDAESYEAFGRVISLVWRHTGIHFVTQTELPQIGAASLPPNLFALVIHLNDGPSRLGCTSLVALAAAITALNVYKLALQFGATERDAFLVTMLFYFDPAFLHYTSDMFKDGLVICFTMGALGSALRLTFKFSVIHAIIGSICVLALWHVRFYLVFVTLAPLGVGLVGVGSRSLARPVIAALLLSALMIGLVAFTDVLQLTAERANETFMVGTSEAVMQSNASGGSGVEFDDGGSPFGALGLKLAYTLFSPFFWKGGSVGFHIGKLDAFIWYYLIYRSLRAVRVADRRLLLALVVFLVPCTLMYAMSMANVGLIVRQRLVIVAATAVLAAIYHPRRVELVTSASPAAIMPSQ